MFCIGFVDENAEWNLSGGSTSMISLQKGHSRTATTFTFNLLIPSSRVKNLRYHLMINEEEKPIIHFCEKILDEEEQLKRVLVCELGRLHAKLIK